MLYRFCETYRSIPVEFFLIDNDIWYDLKSLNLVLECLDHTSSWDDCNLNIIPKYHFLEHKEQILLNERALSYWFIFVASDCGDIEEFEKKINEITKEKKREVSQQFTKLGIVYNSLNESITFLDSLKVDKIIKSNLLNLRNIIYETLNSAILK